MVQHCKTAIHTRDDGVGALTEEVGRKPTAA